MDKQNLIDLIKNINNINDKVFKATFKHKLSVIEYLQTFATTIAEQLDLENLTLDDTNFIGDDLDEFFQMSCSSQRSKTRR